MKVSALLESLPGVGKVRAEADRGAARHLREPPCARPRLQPDRVPGAGVRRLRRRRPTPGVRGAPGSWNNRPMAATSRGPPPSPGRPSAADRALRPLRRRQEHGRRPYAQGPPGRLALRVGHHPQAPPGRAGRRPVLLRHGRRVRQARRQRRAAGMGRVRPATATARPAAPCRSAWSAASPSCWRSTSRSAPGARLHAGRAARLPGPAELGRAGPQAHRTRHRVPEVIERRLETAKIELAAESEFDVTLVNTSVEDVARELLALMDVV